MRGRIQGVLLAVLMGAAGLAVADEVADGLAIAKSKCFGCHNQDKVINTLAKRKPEAERAAHWDKFLPTHNAPDAKERKALIAYMLQAAK